MHLQAQKAWLEYIDALGDTTILLSDLQRLGYSYEEINNIFRQAIDTSEKVDIEALTSQNPST